MGPFLENGKPNPNPDYAAEQLKQQYDGVFASLEANGLSQTQLKISGLTLRMNLYCRRENSGVFRDPSSQKIFELAENIWQNAHANL